MATNNRYPLSTIDGNSIPLDVMKPVGVQFLSFTVASTSPIQLPPNTQVIAVRTTTECLIKYANAAAVIPAYDGTLVEDSQYLNSSEIQFIVPPSLYLSVIGMGGSGLLTIQILETWTGLGTETQFQSY